MRNGSVILPIADKFPTNTKLYGIMTPIERVEIELERIPRIQPQLVPAVLNPLHPGRHQTGTEFQPGEAVIFSPHCPSS